MGALRLKAETPLNFMKMRRIGNDGYYAQTYQVCS
jgi:hypothetical protein